MIGETKKPGRGGARPGAGRKAEGRIAVQFRVSRETYDKLERMSERQKIPRCRIIDNLVGAAEE